MGRARVANRHTRTDLSALPDEHAPAAWDTQVQLYGRPGSVPTQLHTGSP